MLTPYKVIIYPNTALQRIWSSHSSLKSAVEELKKLYRRGTACELKEEK